MNHVGHDGLSDGAIYRGGALDPTRFSGAQSVNGEVFFEYCASHLQFRMPAFCVKSARDLPSAFLLVL